MECGIIIVYFLRKFCQYVVVSIHSPRSIARKLLASFGWELRPVDYSSPEDLILRRFLKALRPAAIFDVGANIGQYAASVRKCGFAGRIVSFEAIPSVHATLMVAAEKDPNWIVAPCCALGRKAGEARINVAGNSWSSSILAMGDVHLKAAPESRYLGQEVVRLERLDQIAVPFLPTVGGLLLKVDTQGYEEEVLAGAAALMDRVSAMQLELSLEPLYHGAPDWRRMLELSQDLGFELHGLIPGFCDKLSGKLLQVDGLFLRKAGGVMAPVVFE
jgi:FkbM family methyltransferase